jgi:hypothetical protein
MFIDIKRIYRNLTRHSCYRESMNCSINVFHMKKKEVIGSLLTPGTKISLRGVKTKINIKL